MYVTICDLHGHRGSQVMVLIESLYMSSYLCIIVTIGISSTVTEIYTCNNFVTMVTFSKDIFRPFFVGTYRFYDLDSLEITSRIILVFT